MFQWSYGFIDDSSLTTNLIKGFFKKKKENKKQTKRWKLFFSPTTIMMKRKIEKSKNNTHCFKWNGFVGIRFDTITKHIRWRYIPFQTNCVHKATKHFFFYKKKKRHVKTKQSEKTSSHLSSIAHHHSINVRFCQHNSTLFRQWQDFLWCRVSFECAVRLVALFWICLVCRPVERVVRVLYIYICVGHTHQIHCHVCVTRCVIKPYNYSSNQNQNSKKKSKINYI